MAKDTDRPQLTSSAVMSFPQPPLRKAEEYLKAYQGYAYTAISSIAQEVASIDLHLFKVKYNRTGAVTDEIFDHEALSTLHYANPLIPFYDLVEATQVYLELVGEAFWVVLREKGESGQPQEIWPIRPDWVSIVPSKDSVVGSYTYNPGGLSSDKLVIPKANMIHFKYLNPMNPYRGKGSIQAAAMPLDTYQFAQEWNRNFFFNSAVPGLILTTEKKMDAKLIERFMAQWQATYGGRANANKVAFLGGGFKIDKITMGSKELDFTEQQKVLRDDILAVFKVPKTIIGLTDDVNRANAEATTRAFMERVVTPRMKKFVGQLNEFYLPMFGEGTNLFLDFTDPSPEDVEAKLKYYENARKYNWMTPNEIRVEENLEPIEGGDELAPMTSGAKTSDTEEEPTDGNEPTDDVSDDEEGNEEDTEDNKPDNEDEDKEDKKGLLQRLFGVKSKKVIHRYIPPAYLRQLQKPKFKHMMAIPKKRPEQIKREKFQKGLANDIKSLLMELVKVKDVGLKMNESPKKEEAPQKTHEDIWTEEAKVAYWNEFVKRATEKEMDLRRKIIGLFDEEEHIVLDNLEAMKYYSKYMRKSRLTDLLPNLKDRVGAWESVFLPFMRELIKAKGDEVLEFLGVNQDFDLTSDYALEYLQEHGAELVTAINEFTREELRKELEAGFANEEDVNQIRQRIIRVFAAATSERAINIARTETIRASNFAATESYRQSGVVKGKQWLAERDNRTCGFCEVMDGKMLELEEVYFKQGESLEVDGKTMSFNLLDVSYPPLHPQCRCTVIPVVYDAPSSLNALKSDIEGLVGKARTQDGSFQAGVNRVAKQFKGSKVLHGPVKKPERILEKATTEYATTKNPMKYLMDTNRATILISNPKDFSQVVDAVKNEYGNVVRVKDKWEIKGYQSAIINVTGEKGVVSEIAVTSPEMWKAKTDGGGDKLYHMVRCGKDKTGEFAEKMDKLYTEARAALDQRLKE